MNIINKIKFTSGTARSSSHQLNVLYFLLKRDLAKSPVTSSRPRPLPVVMADHTIIPGKQFVPTDVLYQSYHKCTCTWQWTLTNTNLVVQFWHVQFRFFSTEHVVFGLFYYWRDAVELPAVGVCIHYLRK